MLSDNAINQEQEFSILTNMIQGYGISCRCTIHFELATDEEKDAWKHRNTLEIEAKDGEILKATWSWWNGSAWERKDVTLKGEKHE